ncbi:hypothetical protein Pyn_33368 [Prunus yedoensis var. nudiflora]|uniref:Uncharacterized protein n=1 Tax=Prunus yedoensis var. nudiflora TaxID=2094558 RepID=A0A314ZHJ2_PRUYE|nr:hypothetical protein Pyn_33368 [Prunus yedoensis var. nudiflora]
MDPRSLVAAFYLQGTVFCTTDGNSGDAADPFLTPTFPNELRLMFNEGDNLSMQSCAEVRKMIGITFDILAEHSVR